MRVLSLLVSWELALSLIGAGQQTTPQAIDVLRQAETLFQTYCTRGRLPADKTIVMEFLREQERTFHADSVFLRGEVSLLESLGESAAADSVFERIRDEDIFSAADIHRRLETSFRDGDLDRAFAMAIRLSDSADTAAASDLFIRWIHGSVAQSVAANSSSAQATLVFSRFIDALAQRNEFSRDAVAGLRMWIQARQAHERQDWGRLRSLLDEAFPSRMSYGPRYQLLLCNLIEDEVPDAVLRSAALTRRRQLLESVWSQARELTAGATKERFHYWVAFGFAREAATAAKQSKPVLPDLYRAMDATISFGSRRGWMEEMRALEGRMEFITPVADWLDQVGNRPDLALPIYLAFARTEPTALPRLAAVYARVHPGSPFESYWENARFSLAPNLELPAVSGGTVRLATGRSHLLFVWSILCASCADQFSSVGQVTRAFPGSVSTLAREDSPLGLEAYLRNRGLPLTVALLSKDQAEELNISSLPWLALVKPDGRYAALALDSWEPDVLRWLSAEKMLAR